MSGPDAGGRVLVDVDGTLCRNLPRICEYVNEEYGLSVTPGDVTEWSYRFEEAGVSIGEVAGHLLRNRTNWYLDDLAPIQGAPSGMEELAAAGYELVVTTHRPPETHEVTRRWLANNDVVYHEFVEEVPENKALVPGDVLIDDYRKQVQNAVSAGKTGILVNQPYNEPVDHPRAYAADSWEEITDVVVGER